MAFPKLVYPLTTLANPTTEQINSIKKCMFDFLWDGKPDKIKRDVIIKDYKFGGLKMIDIDMFINSLKCSWLKRIYDNENSSILKRFYQNILAKYGGNIIFKSKIDSTITNNLFNKNIFLQQIILSWIKITQNQDTQTKVPIGKEIIWHNKIIKLNNKSFFYKNKFDRGIQFIEHIYDYRKREFYQFKDFSELYGIQPSAFLKYHQLLSSIPKTWKENLKTENINPVNESYLFDDMMKKKTQIIRFLYSYQVKNLPTVNIKPHLKWNETFRNEDLKWNRIHLLPFISTIDAKLRNFQYKYIMRIIPTNKLLYIFKIKNTNLFLFFIFAVCQWKH